MKKIIASVVLVLLLAGYTGLWFYGAGQLKQEVVQGIDDMNALANQSMHVPKMVSYQDMSVGGFPFHFNVAIHDIKVDALFGKLTVDHLDLSKSVFSETRSMGGYRDLTLSVEVPGQPDSSFAITIKAEEGETFEIKNAGNSTLDFLLGRSRLFPKTAEDWKDFAKNLREVKMVSAGGHMLDAKSSKVLLSSGPGMLEFKITPLADEVYQLGLKYNLKDSEFKPEFVAWASKIAKVAKSLTRKGDDQAAEPDNSSALGFLSLSSGKSNHDGEINFKGAFRNPKNGGAYVLDIPVIRSSSEFGGSELNGHFDMNWNQNGNVDEAHVKASLKATSTPAAVEKLRQMYLPFIEQLGAKMVEEAKKDKDAKKFGAGVLFSNIAKVAPDLLIDPETKVEIDGMFKRNAQNREDFQLNRISFENTKYGISAKGSMQEGGDRVHTGAIELTLKNYNELVTSLFDKIEKINAIWEKNSTDEFKLPKFWGINADAKTKIISILKRIATDASKDSRDLVIPITFDANGFKVGKMSAEEIKKELQKIGFPENFKMGQEP
jgi:hypothetical protein